MSVKKSWVDWVPAPAAAIDSQGLIQSCNESFRELLDLKADDCEELTLRHLMNRANWMAWINMVDTVLKQGKPVEQYSLRLQTSHGGSVSVLLSAQQYGDRQHCVFTQYDHRVNMERSLIAQRNDQRESVDALSREQAALKAREAEQAEMIAKLESVNGSFVQTEKMAAIGQLAAGVAHEINNPIGYVYSNLQTLAEYVVDLRQIIEAIDNVSAIDELKTLKTTLDYEFIRSDISALLKESEEGIERVKHIITALKDFSRKDDTSTQPADINKALETTISVAWNELKYKAQVHKCLTDIPLVNCNIGQLNQVFMNLLVNAAQAIEKFGNIYVSTEAADGKVMIRIEDDGPGISAEHLPRIFEPFYTSKPVGEGTGLGLALTYNIVKKHGGQIEVNSTAGQGCCFTVTLPLDGPNTVEPRQI